MLPFRFRDIYRGLFKGEAGAETPLNRRCCLWALNPCSPKCCVPIAFPTRFQQGWLDRTLMPGVAFDLPNGVDKPNPKTGLISRLTNIRKVRFLIGLRKPA